MPDLGRGPESAGGSGPPRRAKPDDVFDGRETSDFKQGAPRRATIDDLLAGSPSDPPAPPRRPGRGRPPNPPPPDLPEEGRVFVGILRELLGRLRQAELASAVHVSEATMSRYLSGEKLMTPRTLDAMVREAERLSGDPMPPRLRLELDVAYAKFAQKKDPGAVRERWIYAEYERGLHEAAELREGIAQRESQIEELSALLGEGVDGGGTASALSERRLGTRMAQLMAEVEELRARNAELEAELLRLRRELDELRAGASLSEDELVGVVAALQAAFTRKDLDAFDAAVATVRLPRDLARLAVGLAGMPAAIARWAGCVARTRPVQDLAATLEELDAANSTTDAGVALLEAAAGKSVHAVAALVRILNADENTHLLTRSLFASFGEQRGAADIADLDFQLGLERSALHKVAALKPAVEVADLVRTLRLTDRGEAADAVLRYVSSRRDPAQFGELENLFEVSGRIQDLRSLRNYPGPRGTVGTLH